MLICFANIIKIKQIAIIFVQKFVEMRHKMKTNCTLHRNENTLYFTYELSHSDAFYNY